MKISVEGIINRILRTYRDVFSAKSFMEILSESGCSISLEELKSFLEASPYVFELESGYYITRAGVFTNRYFSICPSAEEIRNKFFVVGHRCIPFVNSEVFSSSLILTYKDEILLHEVHEFSSEKAISLFYLYGEEYASQYIATDIANKDINLVAQDFVLPPRVRLTGYNLEPIIEDTGFGIGDRLLCRVKDWDSGIIEVVPIVHHRKNPLQIDSRDVNIQKWNKMLEKALLESFKMMGPCSSIEEQLATTFLEYRNDLCKNSCGSVEEYLAQSKKVSVELFGVETRLWRKGETVPAIGSWNTMRGDYDDNENTKKTKFTVCDFILTGFIKDLAYQKRTDIDSLYKRMFPDSIAITPYEKEHIMLHIEDRNAIILRNYNWFADFTLGAIRHRALDLYSKIKELVYEVDSAGNQLELYPQQELVILSQLYAHLSSILERIEADPTSVTADHDALMLSLEGMEYNFEDVDEELRKVVGTLQKKGFDIIK